MYVRSSYAVTTEYLQSIADTAGETTDDGTGGADERRISGKEAELEGYREEHLVFDVFTLQLSFTLTLMTIMFQRELQV